MSAALRILPMCEGAMTFDGWAFKLFSLAPSRLGSLCISLEAVEPA